MDLKKKKEKEENMEYMLGFKEAENVTEEVMRYLKVMWKRRKEEGIVDYYRRG